MHFHYFFTPAEDGGDLGPTAYGFLEATAANSAEPEFLRALEALSAELNLHYSFVAEFNARPSPRA
jgi:hypothetical protein